MGRVSAPFGVQGWIKLRTFTEAADGLAGHSLWWMRTPEGWKSVVVEDFAARPAATVAKLQGVDDRDAAQALRGADVAVTREALGEADEGTYYQVDLIGLEVVEEGGEALGRVEGFFETGDTSVMVVRGTRERMIPFVPDYVKGVDREAGRISVAWKADDDA